MDGKKTDDEEGGAMGDAAAEGIEDIGKTAQTP